MCVATRSRKKRSWDTASTHPANARIASSKDRSVDTSRSLVGSSKTRTFALARRMRAKKARLRSPPESIETFFDCAPDANPNRETYCRAGTNDVPSSTVSMPSQMASNKEASAPRDSNSSLA
mmetsp:Transcript_14173/g.47311  ORF Transcript_14173/g.47311 Transcript_14173/m.47311 type:complete len:122 (-) Transcript_14173:1405-1770(-)